MRIHIICGRLHANRILQRMARVLADQTGWTLSEQPDRAADINYWFPYLEWERNKAFSDTLTAGWFSHRDAPHPVKADLWRRAAEAVNLRLTSARIYLEDLNKYGVTRLVTPPLDRDKFKPATRRPKGKPVVGTSGFTYNDSRKGEHLLARLIESNLGRGLNLVAAGRGWPIPTTGYPWATMQEFYQGLDIYLCASLIEGVPYGVLEALACGIPVVIPRGVGLLDELPDAQNLHRYRAGDYGDMEMALRESLRIVTEEGVNPGSLRAMTARFTTEAWAADHEAAFAELFYPAATVPTVVDDRRAGMYCVAYGGQARECARKLMASFKRHMPGIPVALVGDTPLGYEDVFVQQPDGDIGGRGAKTRIWELAPPEWEHVLYLDADTEVIADIGFLFQLLADGWDAVFCYDAAERKLARKMVRPDNQDECLATFDLLGTDEILQLNGGVFAFRRNPQTEKFLRAWHTEWARYGKRDQAALDRALYSNPVKVYVLGQEWNTIVRYMDASQSAGILHHAMMARRWRGIVPGRLDGDEAWARVHPL